MLSAEKLTWFSFDIRRLEHGAFILIYLPPESLQGSTYRESCSLEANTPARALPLASGCRLPLRAEKSKSGLQMTDCPGMESESGRSGDPYQDLHLDRQLSFALYSASNKLARLYRSVLEPLGLTFPKYLVILALCERSPRTVSDLAGSLDLNFNTVTPLLKRMEALGLVTRSRDAEDERRVQIELTEKGLGLRDRLLKLRSEVAAALPLSDDELDNLRSAVQHLSRNMHDDKH